MKELKTGSSQSLPVSNKLRGAFNSAQFRENTQDEGRKPIKNLAKVRGPAISHVDNHWYATNSEIDWREGRPSLRIYRDEMSGFLQKNILKSGQALETPESASFFSKFVSVPGAIKGAIAGAAIAAAAPLIPLAFTLAGCASSMSRHSQKSGPEGAFNDYFGISCFVLAIPSIALLGAYSGKNLSSWMPLVLATGTAAGAIIGGMRSKDKNVEPQIEFKDCCASNRSSKKNNVPSPK